ncbi:MAG TPA: hypothetical protein VKM72_13180 [Thermoanaerobaculia bacterium]|nr:hypothetical protein [Thermoanaerobaculia bacterium]
MSVLTYRPQITGNGSHVWKKSQVLDRAENGARPAVLGALRFLQGYLADLADEDHTVVPRGSEHLARLARRKAVSVGKIADAFEAALAQPVEDE